MQRSYFCSKFFRSFVQRKLCFLLNILKCVLNLFYNGKIETELDLFFLWFINGYSIIHANVGGIKDILTHDLAFEFCRNQIKGINTLTENHINYDQIHHTKNNWPGLIFFFSPGESHIWIACPAWSGSSRCYWVWHWPKREGYSL